MSNKAINFNDQIEELSNASIIDKNGEIAIWGGQFAAEKNKSLEDVFKRFLKNGILKICPFMCWRLRSVLNLKRKLRIENLFFNRTRAHLRKGR